MPGKENGLQHQECYMARGFQSSVPEVIHFGLGDDSELEEVMVEWPDGKTSVLKNVAANEMITIDYASATTEALSINKNTSLKESVDAAQLGITYTHVENDFNDFSLQLLIPQKLSTKGTGITKADVNNDGLEDFYVGNAAGAAGSLYLQQSGGKFIKSNQGLWDKDARYEDANAHFFDADGDGDQDLYVVSAGYELAENSPLLQDRLYTNDGKGNFSRNLNALPSFLISGKSIASGDYDKDGDLDLFVGGNVVPAKYPLAPRSYLLQNDDGKFTDVTASNEVLSEIGMVSEARFTDYDKDEDLDLLVVGEWMQPVIYTNDNGSFTISETISGFDKCEGWWYSITAGDFDGDGDEDYVLGNIGKNNKFQPKKEKPIFIYGKDFDDNGSFDVALSKINDGKLVPVRGKECSSEQNPFLLG